MPGCHSGVHPTGGMNLASGSAYKSLVGVPSMECNGKVRVTAGDPSKSYIINKLVGAGICFGTRMPKTGSISQSDIDLIRSWICSGAPNN